MSEPVEKTTDRPPSGTAQGHGESVGESRPGERSHEESGDRLKLAVMSALSASVFTALVSFALGYVNHVWSIERQQIEANHQLGVDQSREKRALLSKLRGLRLVAMEVNFALIDARISRVYYEQNMRLRGEKHPQWPMLISEASRENQREQQLVIEKARVFGELMEIAGNVQLVFEESHELNRLIGQLYAIETGVGVADPDEYKFSNAAGISKWVKTVENAAKGIVRQKVTAPIDQLIAHLDKVVAGQQRSAANGPIGH